MKTVKRKMITEATKKRILNLIAKNAKLPTRKKLTYKVIAARCKISAATVGNMARNLREETTTT
jgi:DNA-binding Lrp family transcriptional regulator